MIHIIIRDNTSQFNSSVGIIFGSDIIFYNTKRVAIIWRLLGFKHLYI